MLSTTGEFAFEVEATGDVFREAMTAWRPESANWPVGLPSASVEEKRVDCHSDRDVVLSADSILYPESGNISVDQE